MAAGLMARIPRNVPCPDMLSRNVAKLLTEWRAQARLSQSQAADVLSVSVRTLQGWEAGRSMPYPRLLRLAIRITGAEKNRSV
jgi:DNA-binding transcriptional regulator YiaG